LLFGFEASVAKPMEDPPVYSIRDESFAMSSIVGFVTTPEGANRSNRRSQDLGIREDPCEYDRESITPNRISFSSLGKKESRLTALDPDGIIVRDKRATKLQFANRLTAA